MIKVGLLGEAPHDTGALTNLLKQHFGDTVHFFPLVNDIRGSQIEEQRIKRLLRREYEIEKPQIVIFIRDLDGLEDEKEKINLRKTYFSDFRTVVDNKAIFLLNIYAIEALILADIEAYNDCKSCSVPPVPDPMKEKKPEVFLKQHSDYREGQLAGIFENLRLEVVRSNCRYFQSFFDELVLALN
jgi:hypothetical protein